jgi:hypothetical protein
MTWRRHGRWAYLLRGSAEMEQLWGHGRRNSAYGNRPCEIFSSLFGFAEWLTQRLTSAEGEPQSSSTRPHQLQTVRTPLQDMSLRHLDSSSIGDLHLLVKTI